MKDYLQDISTIAQEVSIVNEHTYRIAGKDYTVAYQQAYMKWNQPLHSFGQNSGNDSQVRTSLQAQLANALYTSFYCTGSTEKTSLPIGSLRPASPSDREQSIKNLSEANTSENRLDPYWTVYSLDANGTAFVTKNKELRYLLPNEWEFANNAETSLKTGTIVNLKIIKEDMAIQPVFYHVRSTELISQQAEFTRIYFNTNFDGALLLVKEITAIFNTYKVPFLFKCLNQPELYTRTDSAVLYLDKVDFHFGSRLLRYIVPKVRPYLKLEIPLFTYRIIPGISFSEDPGNGQSFGMSRCALLAEGLVSAYYKDLDTSEKKLAEILKVLQKNGVYPETIYLKPNSKFPYDFSVLTGTYS